MSRYPILNAVLEGADGTSPSVTYKGSHNISIAIDTPAGLIVPNVKAVQQLSVLEVAAEIERLASHPAFTMSNPNRVRALFGAMAGNPLAFHAADGTGYRMIADLILELNLRNPQLAARFVPSLGRFRRIEPKRAAMMRAELERLAALPSLSPDVYEVVSKSLAD